MVRSSIWARVFIAGFFIVGALAFPIAALSRTPGSVASQWTGHVFFGLAALGCAFMAFRSAVSGYLKVTAGTVVIRRIRGDLTIATGDVVAVDTTPDWRPYAFAPVVKLKSGKAVRLSDFGSSKSSLERDPSACACGRALQALRPLVPKA